MTDAYPLKWPDGWPRTPDHKRERSRFEPRGLTEESQLIIWELQRLGARYPVISTNIELRRDGLPYSNRRRPEDTGVAVYFELDGSPQCIPCDRWLSVEENARAIWKSIEALRGLERWGAKSFVKAAFRGFEALPAPDSKDQWWTVLGFPTRPALAEAEVKYRQLVKLHHPDSGGNVDQMARINQAMAEARREG